jgi:nucleolar protein 4
MVSVLSELADVSDKGSDEETSDDDLVGGDDSDDGDDQETSNPLREDDFKREADISRKVLENLIKSTEKAEPSAVEVSDIDTDSEAESDTSEKKRPHSPAAVKLAESKHVTEAESTIPSSKPLTIMLVESEHVSEAEDTVPASKPKKEDSGLDRTIFTSNLPFGINNEEVTQRFSVFGKVQSFVPVLHKLTKYVEPSRQKYFMLSISPPVVLTTECLLDAFFVFNSFCSVCAGDL